MLTALLALPLALVTAPEDSPELDYAVHAEAFLANHGAEGARPGTLLFGDLLDDPTRYRSFRLGLFDVRVPREALEDRENAERFLEAAAALVDLQWVWYRWNSDGEENREEVLGHFEELSDWVHDWSTYSVSAFARAEDPDFLARMAPGENAAAAHARIQDVMCRGAYLGLALEPEPTTRILLMPERGPFLETLCFTGWNQPEARASYWKKGIVQWTSFWNGETQVVAMEYPTFPVDMAKPEKGARMDEFEKTGLGQHACEKAAASMFWRYFGDNDALFYEAAQAQNLTIAVFEENNVRTGAPVVKNSGASTAAFEVFVPGGNSAGGTLPGRGAIAIIDVPLWRETKGRDHYTDPLEEAMEEGHKLAKKAKDEQRKNEIVHFVVHGKKASDKTYVTAPFFGPAAERKELPPVEYLEDYEEFFRAYRAAFFHWLQTRALGKREEAENAARFAELNRRLATRAADLRFHELCEELYDLPLSSASMEEDTLETRFLTWISKGAR